MPRTPLDACALPVFRPAPKRNACSFSKQHKRSKYIICRILNRGRTSIIENESLTPSPINPSSALLLASCASMFDLSILKANSTTCRSSYLTSSYKGLMVENTYHKLKVFRSPRPDEPLAPIVFLNYIDELDGLVVHLDLLQC